MVTLQATELDLKHCLSVGADIDIGAINNILNSQVAELVDAHRRGEYGLAGVLNMP